MIKQTEEYNKFINFVKKYNEEVIEMNKKHDIVSGILNVRKKEEILLEPSLFLKKMDNINKLEETKPKKKNNFIYTFGNYILKLYKEKNKNNINEDKNSNLNNTENKKKQNNNKEKNKKEENKNNINEIINDEEKLSNNNEVKSENNEAIKYMIPKQEKNCNEINKNPKKKNLIKMLILI